MALTTEQRTTLAAHIRASSNPDVVAALAIRNDTELERLYNLPSTFIVRRSSIATSEVGKTVSYVAVEAMTDINRAKVSTFYVMNPVSFEPRDDIQAYWANTFSGALGGQGQATRDALVALWRRAATVAETVFTSGTGTTQSPGTLGWEGSVSIDDIGRALNDN